MNEIYMVYRKTGSANPSIYYPAPQHDSNCPLFVILEPHQPLYPKERA